MVEEGVLSEIGGREGLCREFELIFRGLFHRLLLSNTCLMEWSGVTSSFGYNLLSAGMYRSDSCILLLFSTSNKSSLLVLSRELPLVSPLLPPPLPPPPPPPPPPPNEVCGMEEAKEWRVMELNTLDVFS